MYWNSQHSARLASSLHLSRQLFEFACHDEDDYHNLMEYFTAHVNRLKLKYTSTTVDDGNAGNVLVTFEIDVCFFFHFIVYF